VPECGDNDVKQTTIEIIKEQILPDVLGEELVSRINFKLDLVRTVSQDKSVGSRTCGAHLVLTGPHGQEIKTPITYSAYLGEKKGEFVVTAELDNPIGFAMELSENF
jgi:hypothetical protein